MRFQTRHILLIGFGTLVVLVGILGYSSFRRAERIYGVLSAIHESYEKRSSILSDVQADTLMSGILVRDYLLDPLPAAGIQHRKALFELGSSMEEHMARLAVLMGQEEGDAFSRLRHELKAYWSYLDPIFDWTPLQKGALGASFLRNEILPRRETIVSLTQEINELNAASIRREQQNIDKSRDGFRAYLHSMFWFALCVALTVSAVSSSRISSLEKRREGERARAEYAEQELRELSQKLVQTLEEERKSISRELHDEIGQMVTALRMELTNIQMLRTATEIEFAQHMSEAKGLAEKTLQSVRNLAMGLRPSMLDDLGLGPALQWQGREFSRRSGIAVTVQLDGDLDELDEGLRTCLYRVVQESLTNCARHADAKSILISAVKDGDRLLMTIQDNGVGFDSRRPHQRGLGLVGMEERVRKAGGILSIQSQVNQGTTVQVVIPLQKGAAHV